MAIPKFGAVGSPGPVSAMPSGVHDAVSWGEAKHCAFAWPAEDGSDKLMACFQKGTETFFQKLFKGYVIAVRVCPAHYSMLDTLDEVSEVVEPPAKPVKFPSTTVNIVGPSSIALKDMIDLLTGQEKKSVPPKPNAENFAVGDRVMWYEEDDAMWGKQVYRGELLVPADGPAQPHQVLRDDGEMWGVLPGTLYYEETEKHA